MSMFLSMLTADAAAQHGHEFSRRNTAPAALPGTASHAAVNQRRLPLPRNPLFVLPRSRSPHGASPLGPRQRPALSTRSQSLQTPIIMEESKQELGEEEEKENIRQSEGSDDPKTLDNIIRSFAMPGSFHGPFAGEDLPSSSTSSESVAVPELTNIPTPILDSADPMLTTVSSLTTDESTSPARRHKRPKSCYRFGHPPPTMRQKKILRPKVLLQLQEKASSGYHKPVVEVVPGSRFKPRTKIGQKLQCLHKNKDGTGADDLVVLKSSSNSNRELAEDEMYTDAKEVIGIIQPAEDGPSAYITVENAVWKAFLDGRGASYTLELIGDCSQKIRWYVPKGKRRSATDDLKTPGPREFSCSTLIPGTTKHPIVASMTESDMQVYEQYSSPLEPSNTIKTNDVLRRLIIVSGFWVYFCEGWSSHYDISSIGATQPCPRRRANSLQPSSTGKQGSSECGSTVLDASRAASIAVSEVPSLDTSRSLSPRLLDSDCADERGIMPVEGLAEPLTESASEPFPYALPETVPRLVRSQPRRLSNAERAQRRNSWSPHETSLNDATESAKRHGALGALARRMSLRAKQAHRFSIHLPQQRRPSIPQEIVSTEAKGLVDSGEHGKLNSLRRLSQNLHLPKLAGPKSSAGPDPHRLDSSFDSMPLETQFHADVMHTETLNISDDDLILLRQPLRLTLHPNNAFPSMNENGAAPSPTPSQTVDLADSDPELRDPFVANAISKADRVVRFGLESPHSPRASPSLGFGQPKADSASCTPLSQSSTSLESVSLHGHTSKPLAHQGWWQQYDQFLASSLEHSTTTSTPHRLSMQVKSSAVAPSPASTLVNEEPEIAMPDGAVRTMSHAADLATRVQGLGIDASLSCELSRGAGVRTSSAGTIDDVLVTPAKSQKRLSAWRGKLMGRLH